MPRRLRFSEIQRIRCTPEDKRRFRRVAEGLGAPDVSEGLRRLAKAYVDAPPELREALSHFLTSGVIAGAEAESEPAGMDLEYG